MAQGIIWFRNDLRIRQNATFNAALNSGIPLIAVCFLDNRTERLGVFRKTFLEEALSELSKNLRQFSIPLEIVNGNPQETIFSYFNNSACSKIFASKGYAQEEQQQENVLKSLNTIDLQWFDNGFLIPPTKLPFNIDDLPDTFTSFRKKIEHRGLNNLVEQFFPVEGEVEQGAHTVKANSKWHPNAAFAFDGGENAASKRVKDYLWHSNNILQYKQTRNRLLGTEYSSKFSAWLACGCISPNQIYSEIKRFENEVEANESTYWLVFELLWRDYFRYVMLKYGNALFLPGGIKGEIRLTEPADAEQRFETWVNGLTGDDFVDANMRELKHTGFMSNRGRQNVASYLVHRLNLDWRRGARYFEKMLVDYDVFSNWGNWAYLAGVGNDPRENRVFNTQKQAEMYDSDTSYRKTWL